MTTHNDIQDVQPEPNISTQNKEGVSLHSLTRRAFLHTSILGVSGIALASCTRGIMDRNDIEITQRTFALPNLPPAFEGKTITFLSDIHAGPFMDVDEMKHIAQIVNNLKSDIIVIPGDFVTSHVNEIEPFVEAMSDLHAPYGVFACTGNHDYYAGIDIVSRGVEDTGIKLLRNENAIVTINGQSLYIIGVDDADAVSIKHFVEGKSAPHIEAAWRGVPDNAATILLCHKPYMFDDFAKVNTGLMLAGHTHGGQIVLGRIGHTVLAFSSIASNYVEGLYRPEENKSKSQMYVSRGIGVVGVPIRINCPPEITKITLRAATS
jgi:predicted MPP superfamily phosphohydrolase